MDWNQSIFDILGILVGFISIILLLSLVVTALVQATQATIRLRARNLRAGLSTLIENLFEVSHEDAKQYSYEVLNTDDLATLNKRENPTLFRWKLVGPAVSYIATEDLPKALEKVIRVPEKGNETEMSNDTEGTNRNNLSIDPEKNNKKDLLEESKVFFDKMWKQLDKRFLLYIRLITIVWAIVIAAYFQVSSTELLKTLSINDNLRNSIAAETEIISKEAKESIDKIGQYNNISEKALNMLAKEYPGISGNLEEASGEGNSKAELLDELDLVLADTNQDTGAIRKRYEEILDNLIETQNKEMLDKANSAIDILSKFNINGWGKGNSYYYKENDIQWNNIVGVLITAALITFGAPFWFERLKEVLKLKDVLSKGIKPEEDDKKGRKEQKTVKLYLKND